MPYRAKETIHTDVNPLADEFNGQLLPETEGSFVLVGAGGILSDADAEKFGLAKGDKVEKIEEGQAERELDERNLATVGAQERAQAGVTDAPAPPTNVTATVVPASTAPAKTSAATGTTAKAPQTTKGRTSRK